MQLKFYIQVSNYPIKPALDKRRESEKGPIYAM